MNSPYSLSRLPFNFPSRAGNLASQVERLVGDILQGPASLRTASVGPCYYEALAM